MPKPVDVPERDIEQLVDWFSSTPITAMRNVRSRVAIRVLLAFGAIELSKIERQMIGLED